MAWTAPKTFIPGIGITSAELNTYLRDNQLEFAAAKATQPGQLLVTAGANSVAMSTPQSSLRTTQDTTSSTTPVNLSAPTVTVNHNGTVLMLWSASMRVSAGPNNMVNCGPEVVGSALPGQVASIARATRYSGDGYSRFTGHVLMHSVVTTSNQFRLMHWSSDGATTGAFANRYLLVIPL